MAVLTATVLIAAVLIVAVLIAAVLIAAVLITQLPSRVIALKLMRSSWRQRRLLCFLQSKNKNEEKEAWNGKFKKESYLLDLIGV